MRVNPDFWILWAIAVPVTFVILGIWRATEQSAPESPGGGARRSLLEWPRVAGRRRANEKQVGSSQVAEFVSLGVITSHESV